MNAELARRQAEYERTHSGVPHLAEDLSEAQLDGRACIRCGDEHQSMQPAEGSSVLSAQRSR